MTLTRRGFLAGSSTLGAGLLAAAFSRRSIADPMGLPVGIQLYSVSEPLAADAPGTLKTLYQIGYREVESVSLGKYSGKEFRKLLDDAGLACPSAHLRLNSPEIDLLLETAHALGVQYATTSNLRPSVPPQAGSPPGTPATVLLPTPMGLDGFKKLAQEMNAIGAKVKASGLQYAYHNHNYEFEPVGDGACGYDVLLKETDPALVKFEIDCGWMVVAGASPVAYFRNHPGRFRLLHVKDFKQVSAPTTTLYGPGRPEGEDLGRGFIDYAPIFAAGKAAGIRHVFDEQERPFPVSQLSSARANYAFLHSAS